MILMIWIGQYLEKLGIAVTTADILRRAAVRAVAAVNQGRRDADMREPILDHHDVVPVVAEVVNIVEAARVQPESFHKCHVFLVDVLEFFGRVWIQIAIPNAADDELMQVTVGPSERGLKDPM